MQRTLSVQPATSWRSHTVSRVPVARNVAARAFIPDFLHLSDAGALHHLTHNLTPHILTLADVSDAAGVAAQAAETTVKATAKGDGPFDFLAIAFESLLESLDSGLERLGVPYSYGFAIILLTLLVKIGTFPLTAKQVQSTVAVQAIQPRVKELQARYPNDPERLQMETAKLYKDAGVNPLAGCLPTLATIPVFIGLYRALTLAAQDGLLNDGFFGFLHWEGRRLLMSSWPARACSGSCRLWMGILLLGGSKPLRTSSCRSFWSCRKQSARKSSRRRVMILHRPRLSKCLNSSLSSLVRLATNCRPAGWFSLNVPSGLTLYWFTNNILTTAQQVYLKSQAKVTVLPPVGTIVKDRTEMPVLDAKPTGAETNARRSKGEKFRARKAAGSSDTLRTAANARGKKGKGDKFKERKQLETQQKVATEQPISEPQPEESVPVKQNNGANM